MLAGTVFALLTLAIIMFHGQIWNLVVLIVAR